MQTVQANVKDLQVIPPGPKGNLVVTTLKNKLLGKKIGRLELLRSMTAYGDIAHAQISSKVHGYFVRHPDYIKQVLVDEADKFYKTPGFKKNAPDIADGLLLTEGATHKRQRKLAQPAFHHHRVMAYGDVMVEYTERMLARWHDGETRDIHDEMMYLTMQIVSKTLFDADVTEDASALGDAVETSIRAINARIINPLTLPMWVPTPEHKRINDARETLRVGMRSFIDARRADGRDRGDLLSMLMLARDEDTGDGYSDRELMHQIQTMFAAGHETTANALAWAFYLLAQHPEIVAKLSAEVDTLDGKPPTAHDLARLPFTDKIVKEAMRLYPPAWIVTRLVVAPVEIGGYPIAPGSLVFVSQYFTHRDPRWFPNPEAFDPDRWTPEFEKNLPKYAYFPFGGGPRVCIGQQFAMMEARLILAAIAQKWTMALVPDQTIEMEPVVTLRAKDGIQVALHERRIPAAESRN